MEIHSRPIEILLVEDNRGDVRLTEEALRDGKIVNRLSVVEDGIDAMAFVRRQGRYANAPRPDLILLDLGLPRKDGREVLAELKADDDLKSIPVVILTTSRSDKDILRSIDLQVNAYITKPVDVDQFLTVVRAIKDFYLTVMRELPV